MHMFARYWRWMRQCKALSWWTVILAGIAALAEGGALVVLIPIFDIFSGPHSGSSILQKFGWEPDNETLLWASIGAFVFLAFLAAVTRALSEILGMWVKSRVETAMRQEMTDRLLGMEWSHFMRLRQGDISKAMVMEGMQVGTGAMYLVSAAGSLFAAGCYLIISFVMAPDLTFLALAFGALGGGVYVLGGRRVRKHADQLSQMVGDIGEKSAELFGNLKYFRATGGEQSLRARARELFDGYGTTYLKSQIYAPALRGGIEILAALFIAGFIFYHLGVKQGSVAGIILFLAVFYRMVPRILNGQSFLFQARTYLTWLDTYEERLKLAESHELPPAGSFAPVFEKSLRFENVSFTYVDAPAAVLNGIDLDIKKGSCIALVGPSGGGKTTLTDLLTGLARPTDGRITVDGTNLQEISPTMWRQRIGLVMQEPLILHSSVAANVMMGSAVTDYDKLQRCLMQADAWDFVVDLPDGINTIVAEKGARLSGGQRQRIAIARALYRDPELLILDEATSALDSHAEERVQTVIERMKGSVTMVIVAHRLKTVRLADQIVFLRDAGIVEQGTWNQLMDKQGAFYDLAKSQGAVS